jgi:flagellar M-ring protein FliF
MLEPLAGAGNVRATVNVSYDEGSEERTDEVYDPAQSAAPTTQTSEQTSGDMRGARGVPGTPPLLRKDALPEFPRSGEVTRHLTHTEMGPGRVRRLTAAVLVNDRMTTDTTGKVAKTVWKPRSAEEMQRLEGLAQAAVGFDEKRGDQVVMENVSFSSNAPEVPAARVDKAVEQAKGLLATQPAMLKTGVMGLLGAMVVWFVLRPVAGQVVATLKEPVLVGDGGGRTAAVASGLPGVGGAEAVVLEERAAGRFAEVSGHMKRNPVHSMRLIEAWIASEGED